MRKWLWRAAIVAPLAMSLLLPVAAPAQASPTQVVSATSQFSTHLSATLPLLRLHLSVAVSAARLPELKVVPTLATRWQQIGPRDVQAVAVASPLPSLSYAVSLPTTLRCSATCTVVTAHTVQSSVGVNVTWEEQLLAQLNYLPVSFTPLGSAPSPSLQVPGNFEWRFPLLPKSFSSQWRTGADNTIFSGAVMNFQNVHGLSATGVVDPTTWDVLVHAVSTHQMDPGTYNYVDVTESSPEVVTLYLNGVGKFRTLANTGISVSPTELGTFPVYLRYTTQTMSGTNPDGTHYSDPGLPWVSYFYGGDALHGFIRSSYGYPQSLGCVEMPFASAGLVWPHTPIGTLVTVRA